MSKKSNYTSTNRSKHYLKAHIIFAVKYRKPLLVGQLNDDMKQLLQNISDGSDFEIEIMESDVNHIHFLIKYIPRLSISSIVRKLKQESTFHIWRMYRQFLLNQFWVEKTFWSLISHRLKTDGFYAPKYKKLPSSNNHLYRT